MTAGGNVAFLSLAPWSGLDSPTLLVSCVTVTNRSHTVAALSRFQRGTCLNSRLSVWKQLESQTVAFMEAPSHTWALTCTERSPVHPRVQTEAKRTAVNSCGFHGNIVFALWWFIVQLTEGYFQQRMNPPRQVREQGYIHRETLQRTDVAEINGSTN